jgi:hypothetical protein
VLDGQNGGIAHRRGTGVPFSLPARYNPDPGLRLGVKYVEFRDAVVRYLDAHPKGAAWRDLRMRVGLPYRVPCYTWVYRMEREVGLRRHREGRSMVWTVRPRRRGRSGS